MSSSGEPEMAGTSEPASSRDEENAKETARSPGSNWRKLRNGVAWIVSRWAIVSGGVFTAFFLYLIFQTIFRANSFDLTVFVVPKQLADNGFTGSVVAQRILDEVNKIHADAKTRIKMLTVDIRPDTSGVVIPAAGISVDVIATAMRKMLPGDWVHEISGEFTQSDATTTLRMRMNDEMFFSQSKQGPDPIDGLIEEGALGSGPIKGLA